MKLIITCEHAGNDIPKDLKDSFKDSQRILSSHRGYDLGAKDLFFHLKELADSSYWQTISRLVIEMNRSNYHPGLFSEYTKSLSPAQKEVLLKKYYFTYRNAVEEEVQSFISNKEKVLHLSVHSFTPELHGERRKADIGLLYDPSRAAEKDFCSELKKTLLQLSPNLIIRFNYPYLGKADGFTTYLRKKFKENYMGIELEVNQCFAMGKTNNEMEAEIKIIIYKALGGTLKKFAVYNK